MSVTLVFEYFLGSLLPEREAKFVAGAPLPLNRVSSPFSQCAIILSPICLHSLEMGTEFSGDHTTECNHPKEKHLEAIKPKCPAMHHYISQLFKFSKLNNLK